MDIPFTDTHLHFWDLREPQLVYPWLETEWIHPVLGDHGAIKSLRYWPEDFVKETRFSPPHRIIHVQATAGESDPVHETIWLQKVLAGSGLDYAIVARAGIDRPDLQDVLDRHRAAGPVVGIRDQRYDSYLFDDAWIAGLITMEREGLVVCDDPEVDEMGQAANVMRDRPGLTYCVDHTGWPKERSPEYFERWRASMAALAALPNTVVKISGLGMSDPGWTVESLRPWVDASIELWGTDRAMFGTNWPVDRLFSSYAELVGAYRELVSGFSESEQRALLSGNADRVFA